MPRVLLCLGLAYQDGRDEYAGVMRYLSECNRDWEIILEREGLRAERWRRIVAEGLDGVITDCLPSKAVCRDWRISKVPLVLLNFAPEDVPKGIGRNLVQVVSDEEEIGRMAARELLTCGDYRSFGFVGMPWSGVREAGFASELASVGRVHVALNSESPMSGLRRLPKPAAVFVACDRKAVGVIASCRRAGIRVPEDVAVLGVDNEELTCRHTIPTLSSLKLDFVAAGYEAASALDALLRRQPHATRVVYHALDVARRGSTCAPSPAGDLVERAKDVIRAAASDSAFNVDALAKRLKVSRRLIDRRFRDIASMTAHEAIDAFRLATALELIRTTQMEIREVAAASGFSSHSYFDRKMRAVCGKSPLAVREESRGLSKSASRFVRKMQ